MIDSRTTCTYVKDKQQAELMNVRITTIVIFSVLTLYRHIKTAPLYSSTVTGTLADVDGWAVTFGTGSRGLGAGRAAAPPSPSSLYQM